MHISPAGLLSPWWLPSRKHHPLPPLLLCYYLPRHHLDLRHPSNKRIQARAAEFDSDDSFCMKSRSQYLIFFNLAAKKYNFQQFSAIQTLIYRQFFTLR